MNASCFFAVVNLGCVSGVRIKKYMLGCSALVYLYAIHIMFVDKDWQKS